MSLKERVTSAKCEDLLSVVQTANSKYIVFTRCENDHFIVCSSDGYDVWRVELDDDQLQAHQELVELNSEAFLNKLRSGFLSKSIQISQDGVKATLDISAGSKTLTFELFEAKVVEKKMELQGLMFLLAEKCSDLNSQLETANTRIDNLQHQKAAGGAGGAGVFDIGDGGKKSPQKPMQKKTGMSVINPGSRKRKAPRGVQFD